MRVRESLSRVVIELKDKAQILATKSVQNYWKYVKKGVPIVLRRMTIGKILQNLMLPKLGVKQALVSLGAFWLCAILKYSTIDALDTLMGCKAVRE